MHRQTYSKGQTTEIVSAPMPDGTTQYFEVNLFVIKNSDGSTVGLAGVNRNITKRQLEEQELIKAKEKAEESEEQLKRIANNFVDGMIYQVAMFDENKREFNYVSDAVTRLYGCTPEQAIENPDLIYGKLHPDDVGELINIEKEALRNMSVFRTECRVINPDGSVRWSYYVSQPRIINNIVCWDGIEVDITKQKQIENELIIAKEKAEESDRLKSAFLANMSHEIRTPMNGILGFTDLLEDPDTSQKERGKYISIIKNSGERLLELINNLIDFSKIEAGQMVIYKTNVDLAEIYERLDGIFHSEITQKKNELSFHNESLQRLVFTDRNFLESVLINLIKNAIKFTEKGFISVNCIKDTEGLVFSIQDTGIGVHKENINSIFERFRQDDISLTKNYEGAGLGLAISKSYIELLGGTIWAESEVGKGSTFYFTIPLPENN